MFALWIEYEDGSSAESEAARQLDKYEMVVQADDYERAQGKTLDDFFRTTENYFTHPEVLLRGTAFLNLCFKGGFFCCRSKLGMRPFGCSARPG